MYAAHLTDYDTYDGNNQSRGMSLVLELTQKAPSTGFSVFAVGLTYHCFRLEEKEDRQQAFSIHTEIESNTISTYNEQH
jgi:hypothetical protein